MSGAHSSRVSCGDRVREHCGRHVGEVLFVESSAARVRWDDTGWLSDLPADDLVVVERVRRAPCRTVLTVVASPRRQLEAWLALHRGGGDD